MILRRYVLRRVIGRTLFVLFASTLLFIVVDVMGVSQQLTRGSLWQVLQLYALRLPDIVVTLLPAALVIGPLLAMGSLAKRFELAAIKFTGGSMMRVVAPAFLLVGVVAALSHLSLTELVRPALLPHAVSLQNRVFKLRGPRYWTYYWPRRWMRTPSGFLHANGVRSGELLDVTYVRHNRAFLPTTLIRAASLVEEDEGYSLREVTEQDLVDSPGAISSHARMTFPEHLERGSLAQHLGYPEIFTIPGLMQTIEIHGAQGGKTTPFKLALWRRLADPLLLIALAFLVAPIGSWSRRGQPTERRLIEGGGILGLFFLTRGGFGAVASASTSACLVAAFGPVLLILLLGLLCWLRIEHERALPSRA